MTYKIRVFGHPLHPILNHVPIGLLSVVVLFDIVAMWLQSPVWHAIAYWNLIVALVAAVPTIASGFWDFATNIEGERPYRIAIFHLTTMLIMLGLFLSSLVFRYDLDAKDVSAFLVPFILDCIGTAALAVGGWFGGELVYGHGVGVRGIS